VSSSSALADRIEKESAFLRAITTEVEKLVVGQKELVERLLIGLLADGHVLLEGLPGLAKSLTVQTLAQAVGGEFRRIQFTPDLLPSDLLGTQVYDPKSGDWSVKRGPVFANFVLADEINRAPAKVQSALLEAMQERHVSLAGETHALPSPFLVLATQNPVEQEGTYTLPEAQMDRFMLKVVVDYPEREHEKDVVRRLARNSARPVIETVATPEQLLAARALVDEVHVDEKILDYVLDLVTATRRPAEVGLAELEALLLYGASPRASMALVQAARALAFLRGRAFVLPEDVRSLVPDVLRHRVVTNYEAEARGMSSDDLVQRFLDVVPVP
jgi:MoxR-like ATPase